METRRRRKRNEFPVWFKNATAFSKTYELNKRNCHRYWKTDPCANCDDADQIEYPGKLKKMWGAIPRYKDARGPLHNEYTPIKINFFFCT